MKRVRDILQANTSIDVLVPGEGAEFRADIQNWRLNLFQRHIDNFSTDDGIIADQFNIDRGTSICSFICT